jgi:hypothetical protein
MNLQLKRLEGVDLPRDIRFSEKDSGALAMQMTPNGLGWGKEPADMLEDAAAFEAWALVAKSHGYDKVVLEGDVPDTYDLSYLHYNRFLYRAQRFCDNFDWFVLSDKLRTAVSAFSSEIFDGKRSLKLNVPGNSKSSEPNGPEAIVERFFTENPDKLPKINVNEVFRQLPVGLFFEKVSNETRIFPGGKAAIDLWAIGKDSGEDCIHVIELKTGGNTKLGVLSELFFYVNFVYDFYCIELASPKCRTLPRQKTPNPVSQLCLRGEIFF